MLGINEKAPNMIPAPPGNKGRKHKNKVKIKAILKKIVLLTLLLLMITLN